MPNDDISVAHDIRRMRHELREAKARGDVPRFKTIEATLTQRIKTYQHLMNKRKGLTR